MQTIYDNHLETSVLLSQLLKESVILSEQYNPYLHEKQTILVSLDGIKYLFTAPFYNRYMWELKVI